MQLLSAGKNDHKQLGNNGLLGKALPILNPIKEDSQLFEFEEEIECFSAGRCHNVIVLKNGSCYGWGCNMLYEIGLPKQQDYILPTLISFRSFLSKYFFKEPFIVKALCGHSFTLYLDKTGVVYIAKGNTNQCMLEKINFSKEEIVSIHGYFQPCVIGKSGTIYIINDDLTAQPIAFKYSEKNEAKDDDDDSKVIIDVCTTKKALICLTKNGRVYMINNNNSGTFFTLINSLLNEKIIKVLGKTNSYFALSESGKVFVYDNETESELFTQIKFPSDDVKIIDFSIGFDFTCFIDSENSIWFTCSKAFSSFIGIKKNSLNSPVKSTLFDDQKCRAIQVHCGYSHLLILAKSADEQPNPVVQSIPLSPPVSPQTKQQNSTSTSIFRFPFLTSRNSNDHIEKSNETENENVEQNVEIENSGNSSEINLQNYEILNKIKKMTEENEKLMKEIEQLKKEKLENKKENIISDLQHENKQLKEENERLQNLVQTIKNDKKDDDKSNDEDDCFGYKIDDVGDVYYCNKYFLKPTETIKIFDKKQFIQDFHVMKKVTNYNEYGGMTKTYKISLNNFYSMKILNFTPDDLQNSHVMMNMLKLFLREYEILLYNLHPCILKTYGFNFGDTTHPPSMLLEFCPFNLKEAAEKMKKSRMVRIIVEIAYAMRFLHFNHFVHKNLSPENVLIDKNWNSKVSGFGYSVNLIDDVESSIQINKDKNNVFLAPEIFDEKDIDCTEKVDVYSYGILVLFILSHGEYPNLLSSEGNEIFVVNENIKIELPDYLNDNAKSLVTSCCNCDPNKRPSFDQVLSFLKEHDYRIVKNFDSEALLQRITEIELCEQS